MTDEYGRENEEIDTLFRQIYQIVLDDIPRVAAAYADMVRERRRLLMEVYIPQSDDSEAYRNYYERMMD